MADRDLSSYIEVATRIADFREKYPEGTLSPANPEEPFRFMQAMGYEKDGTSVMQSFIVVVAMASRHPGDQRPGVGMAWEIFPGRTPYTRGSELQNAETSAWGRAIIAVGASDSKAGIASREEVANRRAERDDGLPANRDGSTSRSRVTDEQLEQTGQMTKAQLAAHNKLERDVKGKGPQGADRLSTTVDEVSPWQPSVTERPKPAGWLLSDAFAKLSVFDRKERLDQTSEIVGRPVASSSELEPAEVQAVLAELRQRQETGT